MAKQSRWVLDEIFRQFHIGSLILVLNSCTVTIGALINGRNFLFVEELDSFVEIIFTSIS